MDIVLTMRELLIFEKKKLVFNVLCGLRKALPLVMKGRFKKIGQCQEPFTYLILKERGRSFSTHVMDEFSLQEANRFQCEQVVNQEGVGVFESTDDTSKDKGPR